MMWLVVLNKIMKQAPVSVFYYLVIHALLADKEVSFS